MADKVEATTVAGFAAWRAAKSNIEVVNVSAIDATNIIVFYKEHYVPTALTQGDRVSSQPHSGVGHRGTQQTPPGVA